MSDLREGTLKCLLTCWLISKIAMSGRSVKSLNAVSTAEVGVSGQRRMMAM